MKIFVTGGSGFVGGHLIEALARGGHTLLALARSERAAETVRAYGATPVRGELGAVSAAMLGGAEVVVHAAAFVEEWGTREQFWQGNVEGTTRMLAAAKTGGVRRFLHVGTEAALFDGHDLVDVDESAPYPARQRYLYSETKAEAERKAALLVEPEADAARPRERPGTDADQARDGVPRGRPAQLARHTSTLPRPRATSRGNPARIGGDCAVLGTCNNVWRTAGATTTAAAAAPAARAATTATTWPPAAKPSTGETSPLIPGRPSGR